MSNGMIVALAGVGFVAYLILVRAFSDKAREGMDATEFGCLAFAELILMAAFGWAIDHVSVTIR